MSHNPLSAQRSHDYGRMGYQISNLPQNRMSGGLGASRSFSNSTSSLYRSQSVTSLTLNEKTVLGEGFRSSYTLRTHRTAVLKELGLNAKNMSQIPKHPRPNRTKDICHAAINGLRECIKESALDLSQAIEDSQCKTTGSHNQRVKNIERHKKKLEYLLTKVEELYDHYQIQNQMREGTKQLSKAYEQSSGHHKRSSLANVQFGYKECTKTMCAIEAQLESMLGQFHCEMKGIMGFARVMPGDSFEVNIRHGNQQKWKSKGYVSKENEQTWETNLKTFNVQYHHTISVKVFESKRLSKSNLGEKHCDILGLFAPHPQILTVNVNDIGTIKLNVMIQWMPLANFTEKMTYFDPIQREAPSPRPMSVMFTSDSYITSSTTTDFPLSTQTLDRPQKLSKASQLATSEVKAEVTPEVSSKPPDLLADMKEETRVDVRRLAEAIEEEEEAEQETYDWPEDLEVAVQKLRDVLEDYQEHSSSLKQLYENIHELNDLLRTDEITPDVSPLDERIRPFPDQTQDSRSLQDERRGLRSLRDERRDSSISLAIEAAFDFLNSESCDEDSDTETTTESLSNENAHEQEDEYSEILSPLSTARSTADSGIGSMFSSKRDDSVGGTYTTGNSDLDMIIIQHCVLCELLLEGLDNVGPLKYKEKEALSTLKQQNKIFTRILIVVQEQLSDKSQLKAQINLKKVLTDMAPQYKLAHGFWLDNSKKKSILMTIPEFSQALYRAFNATLQEQFEVKPEKVYNIILKRITHGSYFSASHQKNIIISVFQFMYALTESKCKSMEILMQEVASEVWLIGQLKSGQVSSIIRAIDSIQSTVPSFDAIKVLMILSNTSKSELANKVLDYLHSLSRDKLMREALIHYILGCLEELRVGVRIGACYCLEQIRAIGATDQLIYLAQSDTSKKVQLAARKAATSLNSVTRSKSANQVREV